MPTDRAPDEAAYQHFLTVLPPSVASEVEEALAQPHRRYHAPWHLGRMWRLHRLHRADAWADRIAWAIAYHDIVYVPASAPRENEYQSAMRFLRAAHAAGLSLEASSRITSWILASADHIGAGTFISANDDPAGTWFLDLDLEPLASEAFQDNTALIREEFSHVRDEAFSVGRRAFLERFLKAPSLFRSAEAIRLGWEAKARRNIEVELEIEAPPEIDAAGLAAQEVTKKD